MSESPSSFQFATGLSNDSNDPMMSDDDNEHGFFLRRPPPLFVDSDSGLLSDSGMVEEAGLPLRVIQHVEDDDNMDELDHDREDNEIEDQKMDDVVKERTAISAYEETHPERAQLMLGGREISENEAVWSVSSFRPHWGPDKLRDNDPLTYWQ